MSVIFIKHHDENIYKLSEKSAIEGEKKPIRYKTKCRGRAKRELLDKVQRREHATMGLPLETPPDPCNFLRKHTGKPPYYPKELRTPKEMIEFKKKPQLRPTAEQVKAYDKWKEDEANAEKDFITKNIRYVLKMKPKDPEHKIVIDRGGTTKRLSEGLEHVYINATYFGKTPPYMKEVIKNMELQRQLEREAMGVEKPRCRYIRRDQREDLLEGLKHNWEELQKQYQGLPILTDTIPKKHRKAKLEAELKQLEKDIVLLERHPYIYIYDDDLPPSNT